MKRNKGFTLVELLGVIVVLAIIALITIPIVIKIIENASIEGEKKSIVGYARTIENDLSSYLMMNPDKHYYDYVIPNNLDFKGNTVICSSENINDDGKVTLLNCYVTSKKKNEITDILEEGKNKNHYNYDNGRVTKISSDNNNNNNNNDNDNEQPSITYKEYSVGERIQVEGDESGDYYYVIAASDLNQDYVVALKENPLTVSEVNTYGTGHVNMYNDSSSGPYYHQAYDKYGYGGMAYYTSIDCGYGSDSNDTESGCTTSYNESEVKYVVDNWAQARFTQNQLKTVNDYAARLISYDEYIANCEIVQVQTPSEPRNEIHPQYDWMYNSNYWYWTMSQYNDSSSVVWNVSHDGRLSYDSVHYVGVVRPVINLKKSFIAK